VIDARSLDTLQQIVRRESRSLMQYVAGAYPWTDASHEAAEHRLRGIIQSERDHLIHLTRFLYRHKIAPPHGGGYATDFTSLNFLGLEHLVSLLIAHQQENIAALEADLAAITDPECRPIAEKFLAVKKKHLDELRQLQPEPAVTP
jgi:hypothetical protein